MTYTVTSTDGTRIACTVNGEGPPLVLVHGASSVASRWAPVVPLLSKNFTLYAVDRRGRGDSGDNEKYSIEQEFDDVAAVVRSIPGEVDLLGHSFGGVCSLEAALMVKNLRRLILYEPPLPLPSVPHYPPGFIDRLDALVAQGEFEQTILAFMREVVKTPEPAIERVRLLPSWPSRVASAHTLPREFRALEDYRVDGEKFKAIDVPTLLLLGGDSPPRFVNSIQLATSLLPGARLETLPGQQHNAMDTAPEMFAQSVSRFLLAE